VSAPPSTQIVGPLLSAEMFNTKANIFLFALFITLSNASDLQKQGWTSEPDGRGTASILWSCLSTLFICLWASLHLNVPAEKDTATTRFIKKLKWTCVSAVTPEYVSLVAGEQWADARKGTKDMQEAGVTEWTLLHSYYANMGGVLLNVDCSADDNQPKCAASVIMTTGDLYSMIDDGIFPIEGLTRKGILDKSKADGFIKAVACMQATWLITQCIARAAQSLPITTIELVTVAYTVYALSNYALWWGKPLGVGTPTVIRLNDRDKNGIHRAPYPQHVIDKAIEDGRASLEHRNVSHHSIKIINYKSLESHDESISLFAFCVCCAIFGAIHCAAWNFIFPSDVERTLWRVSSVLCFMPFAFSLVIVVDLSIKSLGSNRSVSAVSHIVNGLCFCVWVFARLFLIIEIFVYLRSVPAGCYETVQWSRFLPHIM
jgi:hypothetical protein